MPDSRPVLPASASILVQFQGYRLIRNPQERSSKGRYQRNKDERAGRIPSPSAQPDPGRSERQAVANRESRDQGARGSEIQVQRGCSRHGPPPGSQTRLKIRVPFVPPNPNEFDRAVRTVIERAVFGT
jgi:hypothetical protein